MDRSVVNLIAAAERRERGYADVPPGSINDEIESELAAYGYAVALSDRLWIGGYRVHTPESVQAGNYRPSVPRSIFTCAASRFAHVPDARDFNVEAILIERGEICSIGTFPPRLAVAGGQTKRGEHGRQSKRLCTTSKMPFSSF